MSQYSPIVQLFFVILAGSVVVLYIQPSMHTIKGIQEKTATYKSQLAGVRDVNSILENHKKEINDINVENNRAIDRYLPNSLDPLLVIRDIESLTHEVGVTLNSIDYAATAPEAGAVEGETPSTPLAPAGVFVTHFKLSVSTDYVTLKKLLRAIEVNDYPLEVVNMLVRPGEKDTVSVDLDLVTYSLAPRQ